MDFFQSGLVVEGVNVADCSGAIDHKHLLRGGFKMVCPWGVGIVRVNVRTDWSLSAESSRVFFCGKELCQPKATEGSGSILEKMTAVQKSLTEWRNVFCFVHERGFGWLGIEAITEDIPAPWLTAL
jgi:hypothetical protein